MSRNIVLALIAAALVSTNPAHAGEWKRQTDEETKIGLRIDAPWAKPGMGHYWERWNDRQTIHSYSATWYSRSQNGPRVEVALYRLAPGRVWRRVGKLDEDTLAAALAAFSVLAHGLVEVIAEIDVNPVIAGPGGCLAVDALVVGRV